MSHSTARTGPSGLVKPEPIRQPQNPELDAALSRIREIAGHPTPGPLAGSTRFSIETALRLAEKAPELYAMPANVARRFGTIATFIREALAEIDRDSQQ